MKYWGPIRTADLRNRTDAELDAGYRACDRTARFGLAKMVGSLAAVALSVALTPLVPFVPFILLTTAPFLVYFGYKDVRQNIDGMRAHRYESARRVLLNMGQPLHQPGQDMSPATAPVFNGVAATVLESDLKPMKAIRISPKAAPAAQ